MSFRTLIAEIFGPAWHEAEIAIADVKHAAEDVIHFAEKEITVAVPQSFADAIARIRAMLSSHTDQSAADAQTIAQLNADKANLQAELDACKALDAQKDAQVADVTQQLADATAQITDMLSAVVDVAPPPAA